MLDRSTDLEKALDTTADYIRFESKEGKKLKGSTGLRGYIMLDEYSNQRHRLKLKLK